MQNKHQHSAKEWDSRNCKNPSRTGHLPCHGLDLVDNRSINDLQGISNTQVDNRSMNDKVPNVTATSNGKQIFQHLPASPRPSHHSQALPIYTWDAQTLTISRLWPVWDTWTAGTAGTTNQRTSVVNSSCAKQHYSTQQTWQFSFWLDLTCETWQYQKTNRKSTLFICESLDDVPSASRLSATQWTEEYKECVKIWDKRKHQKPMVTSYNGWKWKLWNWLKLIETACSKCSSKSMVSLGIIFPSAPTLLTTHGVRTAIIRRTHTATSTFSLTKPL